MSSQSGGSFALGAYAIAPRRYRPFLKTRHIEIAGLVGSFALIAQSLKTLEVGIVYAIWSGIGTALIAMMGVFAFGESVTVVKLLGLMIIIGGSILLRVASTQS